MLSFGAWPLDASPFIKYAYKIYNRVILTSYSIFVVTLVIGNKDIIHASSEKQAYVLQYTFTYAFFLWKLVLCQKDSIKNLMKLISKKERVIINDKDNGMKTVYENCLKFNSTVFYLVFGGFMTIIFLFTIVTYLEFRNWYGVTEISNFTMSGRELPLPQAFPFEIEKYFTIIYYFQYSARIFAAFIFLGCDSLLMFLIYFPSMYLKVLGYKFRQFGNKTGNGSEAYLRELILQHKEIIE